jgi:mannan endo-1,4-beta-mannosidase
MNNRKTFLLGTIVGLCGCGGSSTDEAAFSASAPNERGAERCAVSSEFVTIEGTQFCVDGQRYYFVGTNLWYGAYLGSAGATGDRERLVKELDQLKANGVTNVRVLGMSEASELKRAVGPAAMTKPGEYDEELLAGLDFLLAEMAKRNMKAVIYLNNFWQWSGGMSQYVSWFTGQAPLDPDVTGDWNAFMDNSARFYAIEAAQGAFRDVIRTLITRKNTVTGTPYSEDPTIMSWQLANEPRPGSDANGRKNAQRFTQWIDETAKHVGDLAPRQLVSTGNEGWMGTAGEKDLFVQSHETPHVDYLTFHMWPANWGWFDPKKPADTYEGAWTKAQDYLNWHIDVASQIGKPIVLEEFGINRDAGAFPADTSTGYRDRFYGAVFDLLHERAARGDPIAGSNFWAWGGAGRTSNEDFMWREGDDFVGDPPQEPQGLYSVFDTDRSTASVIKEHADKMQQLRAGELASGPASWRIDGEPLHDPNRHTRVQPLHWNADGTPHFGVPVADGPVRIAP